METGVVLPEITVDADPENGGAVFMSDHSLFPGEEYTININGVEYIRTAEEIVTDNNIVVGVGNLGMLTGNTSSEDTFILISAEEVDESGNLVRAFMIMDFTNPAQYTVSIVGATKVQKIPKRYIPPLSELDNDTVYYRETVVELYPGGDYFTDCYKAIIQDIDAGKHVVLMLSNGFGESYWFNLQGKTNSQEYIFTSFVKIPYNFYSLEGRKNSECFTLCDYRYTLTEA